MKKARRIMSFIMISIILISTLRMTPIGFSSPYSKESHQGEDPEYAIHNEYLSLYVEYGLTDGVGTVCLETSEGYDLLFTSRDHNAWSSYLTVQIDGENYANYRRFPSLNQYVIQYPTISENSIITVWSVESINIVQTVELVGKAVKWEFTLKNTGTSIRHVKVRYLFDYQVRDQDGAPIYIEGIGLIKNERKFEGNEIRFEYWFTRDYLDTTYTVQGLHILETKPYLIIFANWAYAEEYIFDYPKFDPSRAFYTPGEIHSPKSDSCALLYWDLGTVNPGETKKIVTYYGVGEPSPKGIELVRRALNEYEQNALKEFYDTIYYYAAGMAKGYKKWGERFKNNVINYLSNQTGEETFIRMANSTYGKYINKTIAKEDAVFLEDMFNMVSDNMTEEEITEKFYQYIIEKSDALINDFKQDFNTYRNWILNNLTTIEQELSPADLEAFARIIRSCERELPRPSEMAKNFLDLMNRTAYEQPGPYFLGNITYHRSPPLVAILVGAFGKIIQGLVIAWLVHEAAEYAGAQTCAIASDNTAEECWQTGEHSATIASTGLNLLTKPYEISQIIAAYKEAELALYSAKGIGFIAGSLIEGPVEDKIEDLCSRCQVVTDFSQYIFHQVNVKLEIISHTTTDVTEPIDTNKFLGKGEGKITFKNIGNLAVEPQVTREDIKIDGPAIQVKVVSVPQRVNPGETATIEYEYVVNLGDVSQGTCSTYLSSVTIHASHLVTYTTSSTFRVCNRENPQEVQAVNRVMATIIDEGRLYEGNSVEIPYTTLDDTERVVFSLTYGGSDLDLHIYDEHGNHVGLNYFTGEIENQIQGAVYSGPLSYPERIEILGNVGAKSYTVKVIAVSAGDMGSDYVVTVREVPKLPAIMEVYPKQITLTMKAGDSRQILLYMRETGGMSKLSNVTLKATDLICDRRTLPKSNIQFNTNNFDVETGSSIFAIMSVSIPENTVPGIYMGEIIATAEGEITDTSTLIIVIPPSPDEIPPTTIIQIGSPNYTIMNMTYVTSATLFALIAADNPDGTGVAKTFYHIYNSSYDTGWMEYSTHFRLIGLSDGTYSIDFYSIDNAGNIEPVSTETVKIDNTPPVANAGQSRTVRVGETVIFDASASTDNMGIVSYEWDYGDGTKETNITTTHVYMSPGNYIVTLTVKDMAGNIAIHSIIVTVLTLKPRPIIPTWLIGAIIAITLLIIISALTVYKRKTRKTKMPPPQPS